MDSMQANTAISNELKHHGIKGMKWGVRRTPEQLGHKKQSEKEKIIKDRKKAFRNTLTLSDDELRKRINRMKLEKEFKDLSKAEISKGMSYTNKLLKTVGDRVVPTIVSGATLYAIQVLLTKQFDPKTAAAYIAPRPKNK